MKRGVMHTEELLLQEDNHLLWVITAEQFTKLQFDKRAELTFIHCESLCVRVIVSL